MATSPAYSNATYNDNFATYYDRLNTHKDYLSEATTLSEFIRRRSAGCVPHILDVGCGTGRHAKILADAGYDVTAIDLSPDMVRAAQLQESSVSFHCGDIARLDKTGFGFCYSLFNVINCLESIQDLTAFFVEVADRLLEGATLLVESWNAVAVISLPPTVVERTYETSNERIVRKVVPQSDFMRQRLDLIYSIDVFDIRSPGTAVNRFSVVHKLVLFTPVEIEHCLRQAGFCEVEILTALPGLVPATSTDRMLAFACKKGRPGDRTGHPG